MPKFLIPVIALLVVLAVGSSCNKNLDTKCPTVSSNVPDSQRTALQTFVDTSNITGLTLDPRGFYYRIEDTGIGTQPTVCNVVKVNYSGRLVNGNIFDSGHDVSFTLKQLIVGWQLGIPMLRTGGIITLYLPPALGYGNVGTTTIPANSILIFRIQLTQVR